MPSQIGEIANTVGWKGAPSHRMAEGNTNRTLPIIDNSARTGTNIDCYVSGQYVGKKGQVHEYTQRYSVYVSYNKSTQMQTMQQVRQRIIDDFQARYGRTFNITTVFVPDLPVPISDQLKNVQDVEMYRGSSLFRSMSRYEKMRVDVTTEKLKAKANITSIKARYKFRA
jgi:hypothetical protein